MLGGPHYCSARIDTNVLVLPSPLPSVGGSTGAGTCIHQPGYGSGNEVCRMTDINSQGQQNANFEQFATCCGGFADIPAWSADGRFMFISNAGGAFFMLELDDSVDPPVVLNPFSGHILGSAGFTSFASSISDGQWDRTNPSVFYTNGSTLPSICPSGHLCMAKWSWSDPSMRDTTQPIPSLLVDFNAQPNCAFPSGSAIAEYFLSADGNTVYAIVSPNGQDAWYNVIVWDKANGCRVMDTRTWNVTGNYGALGQTFPFGAMTITNDAIASNVATITVSALNPSALSSGNNISIQGTSNCGGIFNVTGQKITAVSGNQISFSLTGTCAGGADSGTAFQAEYMHALRGSLDGTTAVYSPQACGGLGPPNSGSNCGSNDRMFWTFSGLGITTGASARYGSPSIGHFTNLFSHYVYNGQETATGLFCVLAVTALVDSDAANGFNQNPYMGNLSPCPTDGTGIDNHPSSSNNPSSDNFPVFTSTYVSSPAPGPATIVWQDEVLAHSYATPGKVWRFGATYSTSLNSHFNCSENIGTVSPNGKWFIFTSDWENTLGTDSGGAQRCDVFAMRLR